MGAILGVMVTGGNDSANMLIYMFALAGAAAGGGIAYAIANNLTAIDPGLSPIDAERARKTTSQMRIPGILLFILWLSANILANIAWSFFFTLLNPNFEESLFTFSIIASGAISGAIAGVLQWLILIFMLPNGERWRLALWIPASIIGWAGGGILSYFWPSTDWTVFFVPVISGLTLGVLEWLILRKVSPAAIWWIPANIVDYVVSWILPETALLANITSNLVYNFWNGLISSIASSLMILFILKKASQVPEADFGDIPKINFDQPMVK